MVYMNRWLHVLKTLSPAGILLLLCGLAPAVAAQYSGDPFTWLPYVGGDSEAHAVAVQSGGKTLAAGSVDLAGKQHFLVARFTAEGALDATFGSRGEADSNSHELRPVEGAVHVALGSWASASAVAVRPDGRIVVAGTFLSKGVRRIAFVGLQSNGIIDPTFGTDGIAVVASRSDLSLAGLTIEPGGAIVFAGNDTGSHRPFIGRLDPSGRHDESFGSRGIVKLTDIHGTAEGIGVQSDGTVVVGLTAGDGRVRHQEVWVIATNNEGERKESFGNGGVARLNTGDESDRLTDLIIQYDDSVVLVGTTGFGLQRVFVARMRADGTLDSGYRRGDSSIGAFGQADPDARPRLAVSAEGNVLVATSIRSGGRLLVAAVQLIGNSGATDYRFGRGGSLIVDIGVSAALMGVAAGPGVLAMVGNHEHAAQMFVMRVDDPGQERLSGMQVTNSAALEMAMPITIGPHPVRGTANVQFALLEESHVRVVLFDRIGRRVVVLADRQLTSGNQILQLDSAGLPAGTYILRIQAGQQIAARRVTVL